ncbi:TlpA disulfide reductase family protein [Asanoa sp. WMMD1127]|uniref:TlpA disulfide reductase family protein n=1 Tax=Asanoa sp. WMMD1127 TaxID=3016107 RepID=UPI002416BB31|nr:TlpA disulfide reductase family protein [Asanoa sp. WMMD1127]MDG4825007.1 TlpA disulfide reductase family protein [Asanoa sp. WMMD1127]
MFYLAMTTILIGLLAAANLLFTFGVVRRLREHTEQLARRGDTFGPDSAIALPVGTSVGPIHAESIDGHSVELSSLGTRPLVAFFSPTCRPCKERLPAFVAYAAARPGGRDSILAVVAGSPEESAVLVDQLRPVATVVVEADQGPVQQAFAVTGFPAFVLVKDGRVEVSTFELISITDADDAGLPAN